MHLIKVSESTAARRRIPVSLVDATDGYTPETGVTISAGDVKISENGAAEANHSGTLTELAGGLYYYEFASGEVDTVGFLTFRLSKSGIRQFIAWVQVVSYDPYDATALGISRIDAAISSRSTLTAANVWSEALPGAYTSGQAGKLIGDNINATISSRSTLTAANVWAEALPGAYTAGQAGQLIGDNINATISSRSSHSAADVWAVGTRTLTSFGTLVSDIWSNATRTLTAFAFTGLNTDISTLVTTNLDTTVSSRSSHSAADVWAVGTRTITGGTITTNSDKTGYALTSGERTSIAEALLKLDLSTVTGEAARSVLNALRSLRNKVSISGSTLTVTKEDDTTSAWTAAVTTAAGDPINSIDPS